MGDEELGRKIWFRKKRIGWGYTPATWQGLATTFVFLAAVGITAKIPESVGGNSLVAVLAYPMIFAELIIFIAFCYYKGER